ncbi:hypothetical protein [Bhargavaea cecembensis]|uniref:hypothetical protein n=1 Tax=Bhargavaea cecembensis TaxID=394098 RepID=UPI0012E86320|nr:hypothetical protein [Bhargavaea cecembensis]
MSKHRNQCALPARILKAGEVMKKLNHFFFALMIVGGIPVTLAFFDVGRGFYNDYRWWFVGVLWIGIIGNWITERKLRNQQTA